MSPGFEQLKPSIEGADRRIDASKTNVNLAKVEAEFRKVEDHAKLQSNPALRAKYEAMLREQRAKFEALKNGNDENHLNALRKTVQDTLVALDDFVFDNGNFLRMNFSRQYAETTGIASVYAAWRSGEHIPFSTLADIIRAYLPGVGPYGSEKYRQAVFLFLNQRPDGAQGHGASYDISKVHDSAEWTRAEAELRRIKVKEEFDFWKVRVALNQPISRPPAEPQATVDAVPSARRAPRGAPASAPRGAPTARPATAPRPAAAPTLAPVPAAGPTEAAALTPHEQVALNSFSQGIERAFKALQTAGDNGNKIQQALRNIKAQADGIALYGKQNPTSNALPKLRIMRMQCEAFLTQAGLALRAGQAEQIAGDARDDTRGFWSNLRVLNAIPKAYRATTGDRDTLTYSEARSKVMDMRAREVSRAAKGAEVVFAALSSEPPITLQQIRGMGPKRLLAAGLAKPGQENEIHSAIQNFLTSPEGRRLAAIDDNRLTAELDKRLAREALRIEEGTVLGISQAKWEKAGDVSSSLASLDLFLLPGGGALLGKLAARSLLGVRAAAAAARTFEAAKAVRGVGLLVRAGEKIVTWSPQELRALQAAEKAGRAASVAKALARGTLSIGTSVVKFTAATAAAEALVPGSGHLVLAACFLVPGAVKGFSEAVGKNVSEAFAVAGGNMSAGQMPEMTRAYLLYLRSTRTQAALAKNLQTSLQTQGGMAAADAEKAASAFAKDLFEGNTGRELEALTVKKKPGFVDSVRRYREARRMAKTAEERVGGMPRYPERYRAGAQREVQEAGAQVREALGPIGNIDKIPGKIRNALSADLRKTVEDFAGGYNRIAGVLRGGLNISREKVGGFITARRGELMQLWQRISGLPAVARGWAQRQWAKLSDGLEKFADSWRGKGEKVADATEEYLAARRLLKGAKEGGGTIGIARQMRGKEAAVRELQEALGVHRIVALPGRIRSALSADLRKTVEDFAGGYKRVMEIVGGGRKFVTEKGGALLEGASNMVRSLNALARNGGVKARALWESGMREFRSIVDAAKNDRGAQNLLRQAQKKEGGLLIWGEVGLRKAEAGAVEARGALADSLGLTAIQNTLRGLKESAFQGLREGTRTGVQALVKDFNAFVTRYAPYAKAAGGVPAKVLARGRALQGRLNKLLDELPDMSPLRPVLASAGEQLAKIVR